MELSIIPNHWLEQLHLQLQNQNKYPLLVLPTGAGKQLSFQN